MTVLLWYNALGVLLLLTLTAHATKAPATTTGIVIEGPKIDYTILGNVVNDGATQNVTTVLPRKEKDKLDSILRSKFLVNNDVAQNRNVINDTVHPTEERKIADWDAVIRNGVFVNKGIFAGWNDVNVPMLSTETHKMDDWEATFATVKKMQTSVDMNGWPFKGIPNAGSNCFVSSVYQLLVHNAKLGNIVLNTPDFLLLEKFEAFRTFDAKYRSPNALPIKAQDMQTVRELCLIKPPQALPSDTQEDADELLSILLQYLSNCYGDPLINRFTPRRIVTIEYLQDGANEEYIDEYIRNATSTLSSDSATFENNKLFVASLQGKIISLTQTRSNNPGAELRKTTTLKVEQSLHPDVNSRIYLTSTAKYRKRSTKLNKNDTFPNMLERRCSDIGQEWPNQYTDVFLLENATILSVETNNNCEIASELLLVFLRFTQNGKINTRLNITSPNFEFRGIQYSVKGFIVHQGTMESGHYTEYNVDKTGIWRHYNDSIVNIVGIHEVITAMQKGYIFYVEQVHNVEPYENSLKIDNDELVIDKDTVGLAKDLKKFDNIKLINDGIVVKQVDNTELNEDHVKLKNNRNQHLRGIKTNIHTGNRRLVGHGFKVERPIWETKYDYIVFIESKYREDGFKKLLECTGSVMGSHSGTAFPRRILTAAHCIPFKNDFFTDGILHLKDFENFSIDVKFASGERIAVESISFEPTLISSSGANVSMSEIAEEEDQVTSDYSHDLVVLFLNKKPKTAIKCRVYYLDTPAAEAFKKASLETPILPLLYGGFGMQRLHQSKSEYVQNGSLNVTNYNVLTENLTTTVRSLGKIEIGPKQTPVEYNLNTPIMQGDSGGLLVYDVSNPQHSSESGVFSTRPKGYAEATVMQQRALQKIIEAVDVHVSGSLRNDNDKNYCGVVAIGVVTTTSMHLTPFFSDSEISSEDKRKMMKKEFGTINKDRHQKYHTTITDILWGKIPDWLYAQTPAAEAEKLVTDWGRS